MSVTIKKTCERTGRAVPVTMSDDEARAFLNGGDPGDPILTLTFRDPAKPPTEARTIVYSVLSAQSLRLVRRAVAELAPKLPKPRAKRTRKPAAPAASAAPAPSSETSAEAASPPAS